jgi:16S rRNA (guanine527-N7)-methyltransferase
MSDKYLLLEQNLTAFSINLTDKQKQLLLEYCYLLQKWNKYYSLTAINNIDDMLIYHILDGMTLVDNIYLNKYNINNVIDIGSGMGVPAIILAICFPQLNIYALDCNTKKTIFLKQVAIELNLINLHIINSKVENYQPIIKFNVITARAFANIDKLITLTRHIIDEDGFYLLMKAKKTHEELEGIDNIDSQIFNTKIPNHSEVRCIVKINLTLRGI